MFYTPFCNFFGYFAYISLFSLAFGRFFHVSYRQSIVFPQRVVGNIVDDLVYFFHLFRYILSHISSMRTSRISMR